jgi:hypothetical protein
MFPMLYAGDVCISPCALKEFLKILPFRLLGAKTEQRAGRIGACVFFQKQGKQFLESGVAYHTQAFTFINHPAEYDFRVIRRHEQGCAILSRREQKILSVAGRIPADVAFDMDRITPVAAGSIQKSVQDTDVGFTSWFIHSRYLQ